MTGGRHRQRDVAEQLQIVGDVGGATAKLGRICGTRNDTFRMWIPAPAECDS